MLVSVDWEIRVAFLNDNILEEIYIEHSGRKKEQKGNVYKGIVEQVQPSINAAFVNIGLEKNAFLALDTVDYSTYSPKNNTKKDISIQSVLEEKQEVLVQVTKDSTPTKGACLTTYISIPGRYLVLYSSPNMSGISKRILQQREKPRLNNFIKSTIKKNQTDHSIIIRTAAIGVPTKELEKEYLQLKKQWVDIIENSKIHSKPALIMKEKTFISKIIRDHYTNNIDKIYVDEKNTFQLVKEDLSQHHTADSKLQFYSEKTHLFSYFNIEQTIQQLSDRKVILSSGAYLVIDQTEALVAIDVNSGSAKSSGSVEEMIFQINIEAAQESARQVRLRNLSGLIVIDFIDMQSREQKRKIEDTLKSHFKEDKAQYTIHPISHLGLLELSRQKLGKNLPGSALTNCPSCKGLGKIISSDTQIHRILRQIKTKAQRGNYLDFTIYISNNLNKIIQESKMSLFQNLEKDYNIKINIEEESNFELSDEAEIIATRDETKPIPEKIVNTKYLKTEKLSNNFLFGELNVTEQEKLQVLNNFEKIQQKNNAIPKKATIDNKYLWQNIKPQASKRYIPQRTHNQTKQNFTNISNIEQKRSPSTKNFEPQIARPNFKKIALIKKKPQGFLEETFNVIKNFFGVEKEISKTTQPTKRAHYYHIRQKDSTYKTNHFNRDFRPHYNQKNKHNKFKPQIARPNFKKIALIKKKPQGLLGETFNVIKNFFGVEKEISKTTQPTKRTHYYHIRQKNSAYKTNHFNRDSRPHYNQKNKHNKIEQHRYTSKKEGEQTSYNKAEKGRNSYRGNHVANRNNSYSTNYSNSTRENDKNLNLFKK